MARIVSIATDNPPHVIDNDQAARIMTRHTQRLGLKPEPFLRIMRNTQIESRYTVLSGDEVDAPMCLKQRNDIYIKQCLELGERVCACIVPFAGETLTLDEVAAWVSTAQVAKQKWPERLEIFPALPRTSIGKVHKGELREMVARKPTDGAP